MYNRSPEEKRGRAEKNMLEDIPIEITNFIFFYLKIQETSQMEWVQNNSLCIYHC